MRPLEDCVIRHGLAGVVVGPNHPVVKSVRSDPAYQQLQQQVDSMPTLAEKLTTAGADAGFYAPDFSLSADGTRRSILTLVLLQDALDADNSDQGEQAACVLYAALLGAVDETIGYGLIVPNGAIIQDPGICGPGMTLDDAIGVLADVDADAAQVVAQGAENAGGQHIKDYRDRLKHTFLTRFAQGVNPLTNPIFGPEIKWVLGLLGVFAGVEIYKTVTKR